MNMRFLLLPTIFMLLMLSETIGLVHRCPPVEISSLCSCKKYQSDIEYVCNDIKDTHTLTIFIQSVQNYIVDMLRIKKSGPFELIPGVFRKSNIHKLSFEKVKFHYLPLFSGLIGLESTLEELSFLNCDISRWIWTKGTSFAFLETLRLEHTFFPSNLTREMFRDFPNRIKNLIIKYSKLTNLKDNEALRPFGLLRHLELNSNSITSISRSVLPLPALRLKYISLAFNPLSSLPDDMFVQMPRLEYLSLSGTKLKTLHEKIFKPVWDQLAEFYLNSIDLDCNCNTTWLLTTPQHMEIKSPHCISPPSVKNKLLIDVQHQDICKDF